MTPPELAEEFAAIGFEPPPLPTTLRLRFGEVRLGPRQVSLYLRIRERMEQRLVKAITDERYRALAPEGRREWLARRYGLAAADAGRRSIPALARRGVECRS